MPSTVFNYKAAYQLFKVPAGVTSVTVAMSGAGSGGRKGGLVNGKLAVTPGTTLYIVTGQQGVANSGTTGGAAAWGGGGKGGNGSGNNGGDGGGGYSAIRLGSSSGKTLCVAGGAGGTSGDGGVGGLGGGSTGGTGSHGTSGNNSVGNATGGTQSQGGNGGTSSSGSQFNGHDATDTALDAAGGAGGSASNYCHGGGGGGGGWHQGGGGQASSAGYAPGGGGGGGSNYIGSLTSASAGQGTGNATNGGCTITYVAPPPANRPPNPPGSVLLNGVSPVDEQMTGSTGTVKITGSISDPDDDNVLLMVRRCLNSAFTSYIDIKGEWHTSPGTVSVDLTGLAQNTHYWIRCFTQDVHGLYSTNYNSFNFWTNRAPQAPFLTSPVENARVDGLASVVFTWIHQDPESNPDSGQYDGQSGFRLQYRTAATPETPAGPWTRAGGVATESVLGTTPPARIDGTWTVNPGSFKGNTFYEWQVQTKDTHGHIWGDWSDLNSFYVTAPSTPPILKYPTGGAIDVSKTQRFGWTFVDPDPGDKQSRADIRYRIVGQPDADWIMLLGTTDPSFPTILGKPGSQPFWDFPPGTFTTGENYEWQVRTYDTIGGGLVPSDWSNSATFWGTGTPGNAVALPPSDNVSIQGTLGCGSYRAFIYVRGGLIQVGEITPLATLTFGRVRDDISTATVASNGFGIDCGVLLGNLRCWLHELVIFRDGKRVWEGPITLLTYEVDQVTIEAKDVMVYAYRRVMRQGYDDSYQKVNPALPDVGDPSKPGYDPTRPNLVNVPSSVQRAAQILMDALAPYEPNVLPYLTVFEFPDDAKESRTVPDMSKTAWEEVDDMAATAGIDYTVIGRRIIIWDTNRSIGRLPQMTDGDFSSPPIITEYGMQLCNWMVVSDNSGVAGDAKPSSLVTFVAAEPTDETSQYQAYGPIEMVTSAYGETSTAPATTQTADAIAKLVASLTEQAARNINHRWPTPVIARVPDNSTLSPEVNLGFDQLVPGVWVPLLAKSTVRTVQQWQKLDSVTVSVDGSGNEQIQVVMSPAPNGGQDPDADPGDDGGG